ncbi:hypothetical protein [Haloarcula marina]|uniref:hypothetical protein n=1 Tax=Haloarcula marina TaxID=2961574 RepID=UPI0020B6C0C2|nr:hypothetical protein [Halomicroarcula marina]
MSSHSASSGDGGPRGPRQRQLQDIFERVTGTQEWVEEQDQHLSVSRELGGDDGVETVSEYVSAMVREDGLSETLSEPGEEGPPD